MFPRRRIQRGASGSVQLRLPGQERELLRGVCAEVRFLLDDDPDDPDLRRLFPPGHADPERAAEYQLLVREELLEGRARALAIVERTADRTTLDANEANAWLTALNDARLVLGTRLGVTEELDLARIGDNDPRARELGVYAYLTWLQEQLIEALAGDL